MVEVVGFEPTTSCLQSRRSANWSYTPPMFFPRLYFSSRRTRRGLSGADSEIRTRDIELGRIALYHLSYVRKTGAPTEN
jgi:hypothetical protein